MWEATDYTNQGQAVADTYPDAFVRLLLELSDQKANHSPGVTVYADGADAMIGANFAPEIGLAKGTRGTYAGLVLHPDEPADDGKGEERWLKYRPLCVYFQPNDPRHADLPGLEGGVVPVLPGADALSKDGPRDERVHVDNVPIPIGLRPYLKKKVKGSKQDKLSFKRDGFAIRQGMVISVS